MHGPHDEVVTMSTERVELSPRRAVG